MSVDKELYRYLPAIHQGNASLRELLSAFAQHFGKLDKLLTGSAHRVHPDHPDRHNHPDHTDEANLDWLADWVSLELAEDWDEEKKRRLLLHVLALYRQRGTAVGLKSYLENYTSLHVTIRDVATRGSFQIGVTSRIGGFKRLNSQRWLAQVPAKVIFDRAAPDQPTNRSDYYLITPNTPNDQNQPRIVYRAEHVKQIEMQQTDAKSLEFTVYLADDAPECCKAKIDSAICGKNALGNTPNGVSKSPRDLTSCCIKQYTNAKIVRRDDLPGPRFCEDEVGTGYEYHGDPLREVETPYQIDVLLSGPSQEGILAQLANEKAWLLEALCDGAQETTTHFTAIIQFLQPQERKYLLDAIEKHLTAKEKELWEKFQFPEKIRQKPAFTELCQLACAEDVLRTRTDLRITEIERYQPSSSTPSQNANRRSEQPRSYEQEIQRLRAVLDREKPAHVHYSLRFQEEPPLPRSAMQIGVHSRIGVSTIIA